MKLKIFLLPLLIFFTLKCNAQFEFHNPAWLTGKSYKKLIVKVGDQSNAYTQKIMQLFKDNWTVCPVEFYSDKFDKAYLTEGNLFMNFERYTIASQYVRDYGNNGGRSNGEVSYNDYYYLNFWVLDKKFKPGKDWWDYKFTVARSEFYLKTIGMGEEEYKMFKIDLETVSGIRKSVYNVQREEMYPKLFDFTGQDFQFQYLNGMEGNIRNMIQYINSELLKRSEKDLFSSVKNESELSKLKDAVLFLPNYWYGEKGTILENLKDGDKYVKAHADFIKNLKNKYPYKMQVISRSDLNTKILSAGEDFYYINYIQSSADKIVSIVNGKTGEVIYSEVTKNSYRIKEKDIEKIAKAIK